MLVFLASLLLLNLICIILLSTIATLLKNICLKFMQIETAIHIHITHCKIYLGKWKVLSWRSS